MTQPSQSGLWANVPAKLDLDNPFGSSRRRPWARRQTAPKLNPNPDDVLSGHNEVMIRRGEHVGITGFFVRTHRGKPVDPIGVAFAAANAERLGLPVLELPEQLPTDTIDLALESRSVTAFHRGFKYLLHDPGDAELKPWQGVW